VKNIIPIKSFMGLDINPDDSELLEMKKILIAISKVKDISEVLSRILNKLNTEYGVDMYKKKDSTVSSMADSVSFPVDKKKIYEKQNS
jgi:hypothetical protein